ncbi:double-strand break repair protein MRE11, putative [Plasmodium sp. DRC-Itaito]|nr:double-strand break repair protein MRE11, putative [Plasmodium sp. DRC-Itaito]
MKTNKKKRQINNIFDSDNDDIMINQHHHHHNNDADGLDNVDDRLYKISIYPIGWLKDERLYRSFENNEVKFILPSDYKNRINILVLHQNRYIRKESIFNSFYNLQLGSSVRTSICPNEYGDKFIGLLEIKNQRFRFIKINLETVRPFEMKEIKLADYELNFNLESVLKEFLHEQTHAILDKIKNNFLDEIKKYYLFKILFHTKK